MRVPKAPLRNGALAWVAGELRRKLFDERTPPPSLAKFIEIEGRANRSDGLESIFMVVWCLLAFMSIKSFRVGYRQRAANPRRRKFDLVGVTVGQIARWCGLAEDTVSHVLTLLRLCGYVHGPSKDHVNHISQPWETLASGAQAPLPAIRRFQFAFFAELGAGTLIAEKRRARPAPVEAPPTVHPDSARELVSALASSKGLDPPE